MMQELNLIKEYKINKEHEYDWYDEKARLEKVYNNLDLKNILIKYKEQFVKSGIKYLVGEFAGGHDEGGFDTVYFSDKKNGEEITYTFENRWIIKNKLSFIRNKDNVMFYITTDHELVDLNNKEKLDLLLWKTGCLERFGSFAFEGHCSGTVNLDVLTGKWTMSGEESFEQYESFDEEGEAA